MCKGACASTARTISRSMGHREPHHTVGLKDHWERWKSQEGCWTGQAAASTLALKTIMPPIPSREKEKVGHIIP